ncbi:molybdopterin-guanine dinucleotide biosynthesis protein MobB [Variovorax sp. WS11]|uniref:DUF2889 domain-containing protein n=1 Tax=Variovorax sp. WS11 TaxID=1105204 RepID=UPI000D0CEF7A|nr:DUF2889 domain-containing protein [Variovorax sp. WS11]NDZ18904.1 DUF2889 domain-containing protein [Variovorax sp. WS11]PSL80070.1 molybdopterin-guanine dinucleotide biosynthesis protein MobB [Variovorax sp. WS11]
MSDALARSPRTPVHTRRITCAGFSREDGLFEIEGLLIDTKPIALQLVTGTVPAGTPIHQMRVVIVIDRERTILQVRASTEHSPYPVCGEIAPAYAQLVGLRIEPGFTREVKRLFRSERGCSHMTELLPPMASTAFQMLWAGGGFEGADPPGSERRTSPLGGCHALKLEGVIVRTYFPQLKGSPS